MAITGVSPVKQAFVRALRAITALTAAIGSDGINEGVVLHDTPYPFVMYVVAYARHDYQWGGQILKTIIDVYVVSNDQVEAQNLDSLILEGLHDKVLNLESSSEQSTLFCRRVMDLSSADLDDAGKKVYQIGGSYEIWTDQATA